MKIGNIDIKNKICLAPMAGISNPAYIKICEEMGVGYAITVLFKYLVLILLQWQMLLKYWLINIILK